MGRLDNFVHGTIMLLITENHLSVIRELCMKIMKYNNDFNVDVPRHPFCHYTSFHRDDQNSSISYPYMEQAQWNEESQTRNLGIAIFIWA